VAPKVAQITIAGDITIPVISWDTTVPGIIVTATPYSEPEEGYRLTHEISGLAVSMTVFPSISVAMVFAERIRDLLDFNASLENKDLTAFRLQVQKLAVDFMQQLDKEPRTILLKAVELNKNEGTDGESSDSLYDY
jgi:hypothetical protein